MASAQYCRHLHPEVAGPEKIVRRPQPAQFCRLVGTGGWCGTGRPRWTGDIVGPGSSSACWAYTRSPKPGWRSRWRRRRPESGSQPQARSLHWTAVESGLESELPRRYN